jgi:hypothetical protein
MGMYKLAFVFASADTGFRRHSESSERSIQMLYVLAYLSKLQRSQQNMAEEKRPTVAFLGPEGSYTHQVSYFTVLQFSCLSFSPSVSSSHLSMTRHMFVPYPY